MFIQAGQSSQLFLPARAGGEERGRAGAALLVGSEDKHLLPAGRAAQRGSPARITRSGLHASFVPKFPLSASEPPHASTKPLLKTVQDRLRSFFSPLPSGADGTLFTPCPLQMT